MPPIFVKILGGITLQLLLLAAIAKLGQPAACRVDHELSQQSWPMPHLLVPQNSTVIIRCTFEVTGSGSHASMPRFVIDIANTSFRNLQFIQTIGEKELHDYGLFQIQRPTLNSPSVVLKINNTNVNNGTNIRCTYTGNPGSDLVTSLFVYEPTTIIVDIIDVDTNVVNITWNRGSNLNVTQNFTLSVYYGSNRTVINTTESHYSFTAPEGVPPCEIYNFSVTATYVGATYTGTGCSDPSLVLSRMLPSLPDSERLNSSLTYNLVKIAGEIKLNASFESGMFCEDYPVHNYTLEVNSSLSEVVKHSILPQSFNLIGNLSENREYSFRIVAANAIGISFSSDRQFYTTDLQLVTAIIIDETSGTITVQCDFIPGSNARGCMVVLMEDMVTNATVNLTRSGQCAIEMINVTFSFTNYIEVFGYDIESNGSIGDVAIDGHLNSSAAVSCMHEMIHTIESPPSAKLLPPWIISITAVVAFIVMLLSILIIALCTVFFFKRPKTGVFRPSKPSISDTQKVQPISQDKREDKERKERKEDIPIPLYAIPKKAAVKDASPDLYQHIQPTNNYTKLKVDSDTKEHIYHILENTTTPQQKSELISSDPDAPELPPSFKPEPSPPPVYQDILDLQGRKVNETTQNEYASLT